jgi:hypothetical protein
VTIAQSARQVTGAQNLTGDPMVTAASLMTPHMQGPSAVREMIAALPATGAPGLIAGQKAAAIAISVRARPRSHLRKNPAWSMSRP